MRISNQPPLTRLSDLVKLKGVPSAIQNIDRINDTIARASEAETSTYPIACWFKDNFHVIARFDLQKGPLVDIFQNGKKLKLNAHLHLPQLIQQKTKSQTLQVLANAQKTLSALTINWRVENKEVHIYPKMGLKGGMAPATRWVWGQNSETSNIASTSDLAAKIKNLEGSKASELEHLGLHCIKAFDKGSKRPQDISELVELGLSSNPKIIRAALASLLKTLQDKTLFDPSLLQGLAQLLESGDPKCLQQADLVAILQFLQDRIGSLSTGEDKRLIQELNALSSLLDAMASADVEGLSRESIHKSLMQKLTPLLKHKNLEVASFANSSYQALLRLPTDETKVHRFLRRALHAGEGLSLVSEAWGRKSLAKALSAFDEFNKAFKPDKTKAAWYDAFQFMKFLILREEYKKAAEIFSEIKGEHQKQILSLLGGFLKCLPKSTQLKLIDHLSVELPTSLVKPLPGPGFALISAAQNSLPWRLNELKALRSTTAEDEKLYIPLDGRSDPLSSERFNLFEAAMNFFNSNEKVLLIQGGSGAGKSMFLRLLEREAWEKSSQENASLPIHIRLAGIDPRSTHIIEDALQGMNFSESQIAQLKQSRSCTFFLDGFDEMAQGQLVNLIEHGGLKEWKGKVVISCRTQHLANLTQWRDYFAPFSGDRPDFSQLRTLYVVPFSEEQVRSYIGKYLEESPIDGWKTDRFISTIEQIKGLKDLIESPFILRMTVEVLPGLMRESGKVEDITLTRRNLYDAFSEQWFKRQEEKLRSSGQSIPSEVKDFKGECLQYCQDLAMAMVNEHVVEASYSPMTLFIEGEKPSPFDELLGSDPIVSMLRKAAPLTETSTGCAFIHKSLLEHFASKATTAELATLGGFNGTSSRRKSLNRFRADIKSSQNSHGLQARYSTFDIQTSQDLVYSLNSSFDELDRASLLQLAIEAIESFKSFPLTEELIEEFIPFASISDEAIVRRVLEELIHPIGKDVMVDLRLVGGLARAIALVDKKSIAPSNLMICIDVLHSRLRELHKTKTEEALILHLHALERLSCALGDIGIVVDSKKVKSLIEALGDVPSKNPRIVSARKRLKQALLRLETSEDRLSTWLEKGALINCGISSLVEGAGSYSPKKVLEGLLAFQKAFKIKGKKHLWYDELRAAELLIQAGDILSFQELALSPKEPHVQLALIEALHHGADSAKDEMIRGAWISEMVSLANRCDKNIQGLVLGLLEGYLAYDAPEVKRIVTFGRKLLSVEPLSWSPVCLKSVLPNQSLINSVKTSMVWHLAQLKASALNDPSVLQELSFHVPLSAAYHATDSKETHFPLDQGVKSFLEDDTKRIMLLLGGSGSGKSLSMKLLAAELWKDRSESDPIPLYVSLTGVERSSTTIIKDALTRAGFNSGQIIELKRKGALILILDGYDEMNGSDNNNLLTTNDLLSWPGKVILTCRTQYAHQISGGYAGTFLPYTSDGKPDSSKYTEITTVPFSAAQIERYLSQFCSQTDVAWTPDLYLSYIKRIPKLQEMIETPFVLRILTEVLPGIVDKHGASDVESLKLTRSDFYEAFIRHWFERQLGKLIRGGFGSLSKAELEGYYIYAVRLATQMHLANLSEVQYRAPKRGEIDEHPFAPFFSSDSPQVLRAKAACPLIVQNHDGVFTYRFLHKSLLEFLGGRSLFDGEELSVEGLEESISQGAASKEQNDFWTEEAQGTAHAEPSGAVQDGQHDPDLESVLRSPLNHRLFTEDMGTLRFWVDDVSQKPEFKNQLLGIVELSKTHPEVSIAAANAMTILVGAEHSFAKADLQNISIPGALLDRGNFSHANLKGANLQGCSLHEAFLVDANCQGANLKDTDWGQMPLLFKHNQPITSLIFSPDWSSAGICERNTSFSLWKPKNNGEITANIKLPRDNIRCAHISPDASKIVVGLYSGNVKVYDSRSSDNPIVTLRGHTEFVNDVLFSPDRARIASCSFDKTIRIWDVQNGGSPILTLQGHSFYVDSISYNYTGSHIASGSADGTVRIWDAIKGGTSLLKLEGHEKNVRALAFSPNGARIASGSDDSTIKIWDAHRGGGALFTLQGHSNWISSLTYSKDGRRLASGGYDKTIRVWNAISGGKTLVTLRGHTQAITSVAYTCDGTKIISSSLDQTIRVWSTTDKAYLARYVQHLTGCVGNLIYSPDGAKICTGGGGRYIRIWNADTEGKEAQKIFSSEKWWTSGLAYSPEGRHIAAAEYSIIKILNVAKGGEAIKQYEGHTMYINTLAFSSDGRYLASGGIEKTIFIWDVKKGGPAFKKFTLSSDSNRAGSIAFSPDGTHIATGTYDKSIEIWSTDLTKEKHLILKGHSGIIKSVAYSPDGLYLASGSEDQTVRLWDLENNSQEGLVFEGHKQAVTSIAYSPDNTYIASGSWDKTVRIWNVKQKTAAPLILRGSTGGVSSVAYSPSGTRLAYANDDPSIHVWQIIKDPLSQRISAYLVWRANRNLAAFGLQIKGAQLGAENKRLLQELGALASHSETLEAPQELPPEESSVDSRNSDRQGQNSQQPSSSNQQGDSKSCCAIM